MPPGQWIRCGAHGGTNQGGHSYKCTKKKDHPGKEHADTKNVPIVRWRDK